MHRRKILLILIIFCLVSAGCFCSKLTHTARSVISSSHGASGKPGIKQTPTLIPTATEVFTPTAFPTKHSETAPSPQGSGGYRVYPKNNDWDMYRWDDLGVSIKLPTSWIFQDMTGGQTMMSFGGGFQENSYLSSEPLRDLMKSQGDIITYMGAFSLDFSFQNETGKGLPVVMVLTNLEDDQGNVCSNGFEGEVDLPEGYRDEAFELIQSSGGQEICVLNVIAPVIEFDGTESFSAMRVYFLQHGDEMLIFATMYAGTYLEDNASLLDVITQSMSITEE